MGAGQARDLAGQVSGGDLGRQMALAIHLSSNHYPPVSRAFVPVAEEAIDKANAGEWDFVQEYPNGLRRTVADTIEGLHLEYYLEGDDNSE